VKDLEAAKKDLNAKESELEVRVELPADVLFDVDKADIRADAARALAQLATVIRAYSGAVALTGHTDSDGSDAHNLDLSKRRAESVKAWLVARESIPPRALDERQRRVATAAPNDTPANKQRNRRVEVVVRKK
jgi:outer membrane protein OmpA-like peptidoglycan-associated protein